MNGAAVGFGVMSKKIAKERHSGDNAPADLDLSVVVPIYNEEDGLDTFFSRVEPVLQSITDQYEIICIDDGSSDSSVAKLAMHRVRDARVKVICLSRNFGKDVALSAGLDHASGRTVVPIDADLQDPPELIRDMYAKWREGFDVVYAKRAARDSDGPVKRLTAQLFYRFHNSMADVKIPSDTGDFRLLDRKVVEALREVPERNRFMKGLFAWVGFRQASVEYAREARAAGRTKWNYWRLWNFALDGIAGSTTVPLRIWTYVGFLISAGAFGYAAYLTVHTLIAGADVPGYASIMVAVLFLGGINIAATGILGEYLGRIFNEVRNRPLYIVREAHGVRDADANSEEAGLLAYKEASRPARNRKRVAAS